MDNMSNSLTPTAAQQQYNVWSILGFVFTFIFPILGLIFSIIGLRQIRSNPAMKGRGLAVWGTVLSILFIIVLIIVAAFGAITAKSDLSQIQSKSRDAKRLADVRQINTALILYFGDNKNYPVAPISTLGMGDAGKLCQSGFVVNSAICTAAYMNQVPKAPTPPMNNNYIYKTNSAHTSYTIDFTLEENTANLSAGPNCVSPAGMVSGVCQPL